jgi:glycosidase
VPFLLEMDGDDRGPGQLESPLAFLKSLCGFLGRRSGDAIMLGEANLPRPEQREYFGGPDGDGLTMQFDFITMQNLYLSLARQDPRPLQKALASRPATAVPSQWANFVRNHDELTLDKLTDEERDEVFAAFAPDDRMRVYGRGIIRRLAPMLQGDPRRVRVVYSLLFSLPGTPVLFYGEEIGMGEDPAVRSRSAVRTPMQWTAGDNGGFSSAERRRLAAKVVEGGYGPDHVNVSLQHEDPDSLLAFIRLLIARYRSSPEMGWGAFELIRQRTPGVMVHSLSGLDERTVAAHNFGDEPATVSFVLDDLPPGARLTDVLGDGSTVGPDEDGRIELALDAYGYRWLRVLPPDPRRLG